MKIEVLGTGCSKCKALEEAVKQAVAKIGGFHEVKKVEDIVEIMNYGVMSTPALVVDGVVRSSGKQLNVEDIVKILSNNN
ncbi:MAG: thioredoxin family protein [Arcobacter sp.]|jgi:small redox-active disulfide protein 2|uniref:Thioredoxin family protein (Thioredoxin_3 domain) n=1 Tax=Arcobacter defluvii TaxID=873191 RepID=A0AAE7BES0_9BACT|nr:MULTISPECIES: thioredoxin family protein [Arcobacter]MDY3201326.1 thioredoxin family protein [Arcobacter sp.]QKF76389.1 thioredoxin family protein (Thioredoxin_3 domain) [Arcobacter defluvii]RXI34540.1 thioredoxin family protein [Arcobacter defluvii]